MLSVYVCVTPFCIDWHNNRYKTELLTLSGVSSVTGRHTDRLSGLSVQSYM